MTLSQLTELGGQAVAAIASSLARGGPVVRGQLIASRFYEAVQREVPDPRPERGRTDSSQ